MYRVVCGCFVVVFTVENIMKLTNLPITLHHAPFRSRSNPVLKRLLVPNYSERVFSFVHVIVYSAHILFISSNKKSRQFIEAKKYQHTILRDSCIIFYFNYNIDCRYNAYFHNKDICQKMKHVGFGGKRASTNKET